MKVLLMLSCCQVPGVRYVPQPTGTSFLSTRRAVTYQETKASPTCSPPGLTEKTPHRKHVQFGELSPPPYEEVVKQRLAPPQQQQPSSIIHIESPKGLLFYFFLACTNQYIKV